MKFLVIFLIILGVGIWYFVGHYPYSVDKPQQGTNIIAFGDSLTAGFGSTPGHDYVSVLAYRTGLKIMNAGVSGDTTGSAQARFSGDVLSQDPRIVILFLGGNDILRQIPAEEAMGNLREMIDAIHREGGAVLLVGIRGLGLMSDRYMQGYEALAREKKVSFVPDILNDIFGHEDLMHDQIHPNDKGYAIVADRIEPVLRKMIQ